MTELPASPRRVRRLAGVGVRVPSPDVTAEFFAMLLDFDVQSAPDGARHLRCVGEYGGAGSVRAITLRPGGDLNLSELVFEVGTDTDLADLAGDLNRRGVTTEPLQADFDGGPGLALRDPSGVQVQCRLPDVGRLAPLRPSPLRPRRLGHVNVKVPNPAANVQFFVDNLGLRLSEQVGDLLYFLRVSSEHHNLGFRGGADRANVHHIGLEIHGWESFRVIGDHVAAHGGVLEYGPGRHGPGNNLFVYVVEPGSGLRLELYADMAHIHDEDAYQPPRWETLDRVRTINRWGPQPPHSYLE